MAAIAVCIPYYNDRSYLTECLESVREQTVAVDEVLIYDDASQDTPAKYIPAGMECRVMRGEHNRGPCAGRNALARLARSRYVHFHDADDLLALDWCEKVTEAIAKEEPDVVFTQLGSYSNGVTQSGGFIPETWPRAGQSLAWACLRQVLLPDCATMRRDLYLEVGGYCEDQWMAEDYEFYARLACRAKRFVILRETLAYVRQHESRRSNERGEYVKWLALATMRLRDEIPAELQDSLAEMAAFAGVSLMKAERWEEGQRAVQFAQEIGSPSFDMLRPVNRWMCRLMGAERTERLLVAYRATLPQWTRTLLARSGV